MNGVYYNIKLIIITGGIGLLSFIAPIYMDILVISIMILGNFFFGWLESTIVKHDRFRMQKFSKAMAEGLVYVCLTIGVYIVLKCKGIEDKALYCTSVISYAVIYFLGLNIVRNMMKLFPRSRTLKFIFFTANLEFTKKIPILKEFLDYEDNEQSRD